MDKLLRIKEVQGILGVSKATLQRWDREGTLVAVRTKGGHRRYRESDIENQRGYSSLGTLYEHLCSAQYVAGVIGDSHEAEIAKIREDVGQSLLNEHFQRISKQN